MSDPHDVDPAPSADPVVEDPQAQVTSQPDDTGAKPDRPVDNLAAEFNRKFSKMQTQLDSMLQLAATQQQSRQMPAPVAALPTAPSDEDLWALAQQGDRQAFEMYQGRIADRQIQVALGTKQRTDLVTNQLSLLIGKYPVLNDGTHPLTQKAQQAYALLVQNGYAAGPATLLEAAKTAIADSPDLISDLYTKSAQTREQGRQSATARAQGGVMGASSRSDSPVRTQPRPISAADKALAARMGIKDPARAKANFLRRQEEGLSALGAVQGYVNTEDL